MKRLLQVVALAALCAGLCAFGGCSTNGPKNPQQGVLALRANYTLAVETADAYGKLPFCEASQPTVKVCANRLVVIQLKTTKDLVKPVIDGAEQTVRDPAFDSTKADAVLLSARNALLALTSITNTLTSITNTKQVNP